MITFGATNKKVTLTINRRKPEEYDLMAWNTVGVQFWPYEPHHKIEPSYPVGFKYHIIIYRKMVLTKKTELEGFDACLVDPLDYAESIVGNNFCGYIGKISNESMGLFANLYNEIQLKGNADEYIKSIQ